MDTLNIEAWNRRSNRRNEGGQGKAGEKESEKAYSQPSGSHL